MEIKLIKFSLTEEVLDGHFAENSGFNLTDLLERNLMTKKKVLFPGKKMTRNERHK